MQGDDSWVDVIPLTWGEWKGLGALGGAETLALVCRHVAGWNWRDGDGRELAQPDGGPGSLDALTGDEVRALVELVLHPGGGADLKAIRDAAMTAAFTGVGTMPDEGVELMLCELYHCPPSVLDEQEAGRVMRHLAYLGGKAEGQRRS